MLLAIIKILKAVDTKLDKMLGKVTGETAIEREFKKGEVVDISGGGVRCKVDEKASGFARLKFQIPLEPFYEVQAMGRIVECSSSPDGKYILRIEFTHILDADRDEIIKFVIASQRRALRKT